jgi:hypothetical protein
MLLRFQYHIYNCLKTISCIMPAAARGSYSAPPARAAPGILLLLLLVLLLVVLQLLLLRVHLGEEKDMLCLRMQLLKSRQRRGGLLVEKRRSEFRVSWMK